MSTMGCQELTSKDYSVRRNVEPLVVTQPQAEDELRAWIYLVEISLNEQQDGKVAAEWRCACARPMVKAA